MALTYDDASRSGQSTASSPSTPMYRTPQSQVQLAGGNASQPQSSDRPRLCRICLSRDHEVYDLIPDQSVLKNIMDKREANYRNNVLPNRRYTTPTILRSPNRRGPPGQGTPATAFKRPYRRKNTFVNITKSCSVWHVANPASIILLTYRLLEPTFTPF